MKKLVSFEGSKTGTVYELVSIRELSSRFDISERQLYRLEKEGMPFVRIGKKCKRYNPFKVIAWLEANAEMEAR